MSDPNNTKDPSFDDDGFAQPPTDGASDTPDDFAETGFADPGADDTGFDDPSASFTHTEFDATQTGADTPPPKKTGIMTYVFIGLAAIFVIGMLYFLFFAPATPPKRAPQQKPPAVQKAPTATAGQPAPEDASKQGDNGSANLLAPPSDSAQATPNNPPAAPANPYAQAQPSPAPKNSQQPPLSTTSQLAPLRPAPPAQNAAGLNPTPPGQDLNPIASASSALPAVPDQLTAPSVSPDLLSVPSADLSTNAPGQDVASGIAANGNVAAAPENQEAATPLDSFQDALAPLDARVTTLENSVSRLSDNVERLNKKVFGKANIEDADKADEEKAASSSAGHAVASKDKKAVKKSVAKSHHKSKKSHHVTHHRRHREHNYLKLIKASPCDSVRDCAPVTRVVLERRRVSASAPAESAAPAPVKAPEDFSVAKKNHDKAYDSDFVCHVQAITNGQVWLRNSDGSFSSFVVGDRLNGQMITKINRNQGVRVGDKWICNN